MRNFVTIDSSNFPIVVAKYPGFVPTLEEFVKAQDDCENFYISHTNFVLLVDLADMAFLPAEYRISQGKWLERLKPLHIKQNMRFVFYTPSIPIQLMMKMFFVLATPGVPYTVTSSLDKAYAWAEKHFAVNS